MQLIELFWGIKVLTDNRSSDVVTPLGTLSTRLDDAMDCPKAPELKSQVNEAQRHAKNNSFERVEQIRKNGEWRVVLYNLAGVSPPPEPPYGGKDLR